QATEKPMSIVLHATKRGELGRGVKKVRQANKVPAIIYGHGIEPEPLTLEVAELRKVRREAGTSTLIDVVVDGDQPVKALIQEIQPHHLTMEPLHVDLRQIKMDEEITVDVPLRFINESPAVKELAGTLVHTLDYLTVKCLPGDLPHEITVDLSGLKTFDDLVTVADLPLNSKVEVMQESDLVVVSVMPPLTDEQLKKMEEEGQAPVTAVKTEAEEKEAEKAAEEAAEGEGESKEE
ncbi:50S ribosomal protein L25, partial [Patescibacteria group bacterium]|nr:50S ribosomal protein L25 [Patescibacteria group bacterium]